MTGIFLKIINMSISASWLILAVLVLRIILTKAPKWVNVMFWGIVAIRLLYPFSIESALSLIPSAETVSPNIMMEPAPTIQTGISAINSAVNPIISQSFAGAPENSINPLQIWIPVLSGIWVLGMIALLIYTAISYWRLHRKVVTAVLFKDNIFQSENVSSPFVLGIIRPRIYLPFHMDEQKQEHVIAHEKAHIRRRDHWWKPLGFVLLTVHWFNPFMWVAYILLCRDIELACDEKVIKELGDDGRADYSEALLACSAGRRMIATCPLAFGEAGVKERVKAVLNYKKTAFWVIVTALVACVILILCFLTNPTEQRDSLVWAQELTVHEIMSAELVVLPQAEDKQYSLMSEEDFPAMVKLINQSKGNYLMEHEDLTGGSTFFYITLRNGTEHSIGKIGNTYLVIDGDYFEAKYRWLTKWDDDFGEGNAPLPEDYFVRQLTLDDVIELAKKGEELDWNVLEDDARAAYLAFLSGEVSLLEDVQLGQSWVDFYLPNSELEYVFMDIDGDEVSELLIQWTDSPEDLNAVFDYYDGKLICRNFDSVEISSRDYPLQNGTIVHQYDYSGTSSWTVFRYLSDGEREEFFNLFARYEVVYDGDTSPVPYYEIDGCEVDQTTFEAQLEERITGQMLERSEWMTLNSNL